MQNNNVRSTCVDEQGASQDFFTQYPRFFQTSSTDTQGDRMTYRHSALIESHHGQIAGKRILDLASHDGRWSFAALKAGAKHVCGIEARSYLVHSAFENMQAYGISKDCYEFLIGDCLEVLRRLPRGHFDTVFCFGFLYHTPAHFELFKEIYRLNPQYLIIDSLLIDSNQAVVHLAFDNPTYEGAAIATHDKEHRCLVGIPSKHALELLLTHFGFEVDYHGDHTRLQNTSFRGVEDYRNKRRFTIMATSKRPSTDREKEPLPSTIPLEDSSVARKQFLAKTPAIILDGHIVSLLEVLQHAKTRHEYEFLDRVVDHHLITEAAKRENIEVLPEERERLRNQFLESISHKNENEQSGLFQDGGLSSTLLDEQLDGILRFGKLKGKIVDPYVVPAFENNRQLFSSYSLSKIVVPEQSTAKDLLSRLQRGEEFSDLAHTHSCDPNSRPCGGFLGKLCGADLPLQVITALNNTAEGEVLGPFFLEEGWTLFRVERHWHPQLDVVTRTRIHHSMFDAWLDQERQRVNVRMPILDDL